MPTYTQADLESWVTAKIHAGGDFEWVDVPYGTIEMTTTFTLLHQLHGGGLRGQGARTTTFKWLGNADTPMFTINRCQMLQLKDFSILPGPSSPLLEGIRIQNGALADGPKAVAGQESSLVYVDAVEFQGAGRMGTGIRVFLYNVDDDTKNDHHKITRCHASGIRHAFLQAEGRNAKAINCTDNTLGTASGPQYQNYGVCTVAGFAPTEMETDGTIKTMGTAVYNHGAAVTWVGGALQGCRQWALLIGDRNDPVVVVAPYSEKLGGLVSVPEYDTGHVASLPIILIGMKYTINENTPADGKIVDVRSTDLHMLSCELGGRDVRRQLRIHHAPQNGDPGVFVFQGNDITNDGDGQVFTGNIPSNPDYGVTNHGYRARVLRLLGRGTL